MWRTRLGDEGGGIAESDVDTDSQGNTMWEHELYRLRHDDLVRRAATERRAREAVRGRRRAARRGTAARSTEPESHTRRRSWFARAA